MDAEVTTQHGVWVDGHIETWVDVAVYTTFVGSPLSDVHLAIPGGVVGGLRWTMSEAPSLKTDHRYLLLLRQREDGRWTPVGGPLGVVPLAHGQSAAAVWSTLDVCHGR